MYHNREVAVVIPIYKSLNDYEAIALQQARTILANYDIIAVLPNRITLQTDFTKIEKFQDDFFKSVTDYNRLMLSVDFYNRFQNYKYILIYQLDAFVFYDALLQFCELGYDYIGAPWIRGLSDYVNGKRNILYVGNGGFSLRCVESFIRVLKENNFYEQEKKNEDVIFSSVVSENFKIAPLEVALEFAFETHVKKCYEMNDHKLPFGCHAWWRYDLKFWKPYIEYFGYDVREKFEGGNEDILLLKCYKTERFRSMILEQEKSDSLIVSFLKQYAADCEYILFGAGFWGRALGRWMTYNEVRIIKCYCDNNESLKHKKIEGYSVVMPHEIIEDKGKSKIIVTMADCVKEAEAQLEEMGFRKFVDYIVLDDMIDLVNEFE